MVVSYNLSIVSIALSLTFGCVCHRISPTFKSTGGGGVALDQNLWGKVLTYVSQILTRSVTDMNCRMQKKSYRYPLPFEHNART